MADSRRRSSAVTDPTAVADLVAWLPQLRRVSRAMTANRADADDLVQDTCVRALASSARFRPGSNLWAWLLTILRNLTRNRQRDQRRAGVGLTAFIGRTPAATEERHQGEQMMLEAALEPALEEALESLPPILREAIWLRDVEDRSYAEISVRLGIPLGTVMSRIARGRRLLHDRLVASVRGGDQP